MLGRPHLAIVMGTLLSLCATASATEEGETPEKAIAVLDLHTAQGVDPFVGTSLTQVLAGRIGRQKGYRVISKDDITAMLDIEASRQLTGCTDTSCMAQIGAALGAQLLVNGSVAKLDEAFVLMLSLIDSGEGKVVRRVTETWKGESSGLVDLMEISADRLILGDDALQDGQIVFTASTMNTIVVVDGEPTGSMPLDELTVRPGRHEIVLVLTDHQRRAIEVLVKPGKKAAVDATMALVPDEPIYATWWFWTAAAVLVAGGTTAAIIATQGDANAQTIGVTIEVPSSLGATP